MSNPKNKLWQKAYQLDAQIEAFTVGQDRELDLLLAPFDILGSLAQREMGLDGTDALLQFPVAAQQGVARRDLSRYTNAVISGIDERTAEDVEEAVGELRQAAL